MEYIKRLIVKYHQIGFLFIIGLILIIYISLGFLYLQQDPQQREYEGQIVKLGAIVANPLPSSEEIQAEYDAVIQKLTPISATEAIAMLVELAGESGIDTSSDSDKFLVPTAVIANTTIGGNNYRYLSFANILAQGDYDSVMAFLSALDSGTKLETMVLTRVITSDVAVIATGEEGERRKEFRNVIAAVEAMMLDNGLTVLPVPISFSGTTATNSMGDIVTTTLTTEGFPDSTTSASRKGYTGTGVPRDGYVLYEHDKISSTDTTQYETVNYYPTLTTEYYYTCEADGTVRQWDGSNIINSLEYLDSQEYKIEQIVSLNVIIYFK
ncbi:hypothetical protein ACFLVJ_03295 [Chloroflexota bacterium]